MAEPTVKLRAVCGCGWSKGNGNDKEPGILGPINDTVSEAIDHANKTGHTLEFHGEVRVQRSIVAVVA